MRTAAGFLFGLFAGVLLLAGALSTWQHTGAPPASTASPVTAPSVSGSTPAPRTAARTVDLFLVVRLGRDDGGGRERGREGVAWEEIFVVENGVSRSVELPESVDRSELPVTDGTRVYAYVSGSRQATGSGGRRLAAFTLDGREDGTVTGSTPLVEPRGLFASPDGAFLAFFLDNRTTLATELWTYDTSARVKRVSVERLTRNDLHGPYFSLDGSFLLHHGRQLLQGSPRRTGVDILPVEIPWERVSWEGNLARSPDGERVLLVTELGDDATTVARVVEYAMSGERPVLRFSRGNEAVRILGWAKPESILLGTEEPRSGAPSAGPRSELRTVTLVRGNENISHALGPGARSPVVAEDGSRVGFLREEGSSIRIEVLDVETGQFVAVAALPAPDARTREPEFRLLQYLQSPLAPTGTPDRSRTLAPELLLLLMYVSEHIRAIADAPEAEPVTAERIWLTTIPDAIYVDYRIGTTLWRRLVRLELRDGLPQGSAVVGVFAPIGGEWVLARGDDLADRTPVRLYEFESDLQQWVEKPLAAAAFP